MSPPVKICDRCLKVKVTVNVKCYYGCSHDQCAECAAETVRNKLSEEAWDAEYNRKALNEN